MAAPTKADAQLLLKIMEVYLSPAMQNSRRWIRTMPSGLGFEELLSKYPRGSEEFEHLSTTMIFWETVGSLMRHGLLKEELAFDTFLDAPPWSKVEKFIEERRVKENNPLEGENIEWVAKRAALWMTGRERRLRRRA